MDSRNLLSISSTVLLLLSFLVYNYSAGNIGLNRFEFIEAYAQLAQDNSTLELGNGTDILVDNASGFMADNGTRVLMNGSLTVMENGTISNETIANMQ